MEIRIKETGKIEELEFRPGGHGTPDQAAEFTGDDSNVKYVEDDSYEGMECNQTTFDWWENWFEVETKINEKAQELGIDWADYNDDLHAGPYELHDIQNDIIKRVQEKSK